MPSRRRLRHGSTSSAPQVLLNNTKSGILSSSTSLPASLKGASNTNITSVASKSTSTGNHSSINNSTSSSSSASYSANNHTNYGCTSGDSLTEKQLRNAYLVTLTKDQLKIECRKRGQKTNGNRMELLQRLGVKMSQIQKQESLESSNNIRKSIMENSSKQSAKIGANGSPNGTAPSFVRRHSAKDKEKERDERDKIVLWRRPVQTMKYCVMECATLTHIYGKKLVQHRLVLAGVLVLVAILCVFYKIPGRHQMLFDLIRTNTWFIVYWVGLGVLSSVGLGTGLHTFLLYLGPHIASVTLAAYECNALNFPKPPYPDDIICPEVSDIHVPPNLWNIMAKVRFEAFLWGAGTALGELPPYFMARAARLSGYDPDEDEDLQKFEELQKKQDRNDLSILDKAKLFMERVVEKVGFLGILACASIPNPLFDLAGITCGHFLVPFWTFFGATLLGKAVIKMHIQKIFVIIAFNESLIERAVDLLRHVPVFGKRLQEPFKSFLENQKTKLHGRKNVNRTTAESGNMLAKTFEKIVLAMICYFVISTVNSLAQRYHKRIHKKGGKVLRKIAKD